MPDPEVPELDHGLDPALGEVREDVLSPGVVAMLGPCQADLASSQGELDGVQVRGHGHADTAEKRDADTAAVLACLAPLEARFDTSSHQ